ncbi:MAG: DegT/DnrJ/EryC1/StrS family aminotransferase [Candidatus Nitrohelix vancouverensis]|uniref:DegT/DnrJ/EryC1/StrS family aminotransferase n=1 Tax=Candidatus Nitrohelix vancouverensis TaxID=2705534 RepID=A0A7T0C594_9BACT|nr:MAG: DegT/DnrJ/EryC1/StrS family aminotransferase [Candidatus Nitrohelix vancouverensis]
MADVIRSGHFILGGKVKEMESQVASYCETPHAVGVSSGTDALIISLMAAGVGPGDEVITTPFTFFATVGAIARLGATPVFVDIEPNSFNIDPALIEERITPKTKAILPVHLYGQCANMDAINKLASAHKLTVIEDAAQAIGSKYQNRPAGSLGDYGCFSFFPTKNLGGFGDGGLVTVKDEALYKQLSILRVHGAEPKYYHQVVGGNFRIDAIQAAVVSAKLKYLDGWIRRRQENAARYTSMIRKAGLSERIDTPACVEPGHSYNQYVVRIPKDRDAMRTFLGERGVASEIYYPVPLHLQECFASLGYKKGDFPHAEDAADQVLALPISHEVTEQQQTHVVNMLKAFYQ